MLIQMSTFSYQMATSRGYSLNKLLRGSTYYMTSYELGGGDTLE